MLNQRNAFILILFLLASFCDEIFSQKGDYIQQAGTDALISIEAENFKYTESADGHKWEFTSDKTGYSGSGAIVATPDTGSDEDIDYGDSPYTDYQTYIVTPGKYYVWIRGYGINDGNSCHLDLDHRELNTAEEIEFPVDEWSWSNQNDDKRCYLEIKSPGIHTISLSMQKDGFVVDKILLTPNPDYKPEALGPAETIEGGVFNFGTTEMSGYEPDTKEVIIPIKLEGKLTESRSVDYAVVGGCADKEDYNLKEGTLIFNPGESQKEIVLDIVQDEIDENDEMVVLKLSNPMGNAAQVGYYDTFTFTILDPRPIVEFVSGMSGVDENDGFINIPLKLSSAYSKPVTVEFTVVGGSASIDEDFSIPSYTVSFGPGQVAADLKVKILPDNLEEVTESIELQMVSARNATLQGRSNHKIGICTVSYNQLGDAVYFRYNSNERWERYAKVGKDADALVEIGDNGDRIIFWRGSSYRPYIETSTSTSHKTDLNPVQRGNKSFVPNHVYVDTKTYKSYVDVLVPTKGDGDELMFDRINRYSNVKIIESSPARALVGWRYIPDFSNPRPEDWTEEYFTIYPDGKCFRSVKTGTATLAEYNDPSHVQLEQLLFTNTGVYGLPQSWIKPSALNVDEQTKANFDYLGLDKVNGSYSFAAKKSGFSNNIVFEITDNVKNPALLVKNWGDANVNITVDGKDFTNYKLGYADEMDNDNLLLWFDNSFTAGSKVTITPKGGSAPVVRAPIRDPYKSEVPLFPESSKDPGPFGAYFTTLKYWELWDKPYRVGDYADVVVQFDNSTDRLVFGRLTSYVPHWTNDKNFWYENEFCERRGGDSGLRGLCEPMNEHENRYTNVRIIQSSDARAIVHWRYVPCTLHYEHPFTDETGWGDYVDEYYYVYPDETCVRDVKLQTSKPNVFNEFNEVIPLVNPGMIPEDVLEMKALSLANTSGKVVVHDFEPGFPTNDKFEDGLNIVLVGMKGKSKPFAIAESYGVWHDPISRPDETRFNHYDDWPAWPEKYRREDYSRDPVNNYREFWKILPSHSSLMHLDWDNYESDLDGPVVYLRKILLNGMTTSSDVASLIPLTKYWENAPVIKVTGYGFSSALYEKSQKAYIIERRISWIDHMVNRDDDKMINGKADKVSLDVFASKESPIINPCFIINNWPEETKARLLINGKEIAESKDFRQGIEKSYDEFETKSSLVIWISNTSEENVNYTIEMIQ